MTLKDSGFLSVIARLGQQLLALGGIERVAVLGLAEGRVVGLQPADRRLRRAVQQGDDGVAVDAVVQRLAHADVGERAVLGGHVVEPRPDVRIGTRRDHEARLLERRDAVGRRHLDPVDAARAQRGEPRVGLGDGQQQDLVDLGLLGGVPIGVVAGERHRLARHHAGDAERPGAGRRQHRHLGPVAPGLLERGRRGGQDVGHHPREVGRHDGRRQGDRVVVDLLVAGQDRHARAHDADGAGLELRAVLVEDALEVPDHGVGVEIRAVVELHALPQMEDPGLLVVRRLLPFLGQARPQGGELVGLGEVEQDHALEDREAQEAHALEAVVGHAGRGRDVRRRHGDAQHLVLRRRRARARAARRPTARRGQTVVLHA